MTLIENDIEHNTGPNPCVRVTLEPDGDRVRVRIADNGPGIDDDERSTLKCGTETPLHHGSGLGLWLAEWGAEIAGGGVTFATDDPTGSIVTVEVPVLSPPAGPRAESDKNPS